ncbi:RecB family exonuclease [Flavobacterium sp.]|jgi:hypothetical protein|uniref:RecB family exonuclease n=1 Tax=Flavobacterium sp. TaxID=239 RepID=UPI0037C00ED4
MSELVNKPLSASRIKTLQTCSWQYWCKYHLKLPDTTNEGSLRGSICHAVFEVLGDPRHKHHYDQLVKHQDIKSSKPINRMVNSFARKNKIDDFDNLELINQMIMEGLNYDFFGNKYGKPTESISEKDFDIEVNNGQKNYRILGFIDKLFLFKKKRIALIRDFKTSKQIFSGQEVEDNMQNLMYCLAVKYLYPDFLKRDMEFLFLKFDCKNEGLLEMSEVAEDELEGFEYFLTQIQSIINNFNEKSAIDGLAYNKGFPSKEEGFSGRVVCGRAEYKGQLKKDGTLMWHCPFKFPFDYFVLLDEDKNIISSSYVKEELNKKRKNGLGFSIEKRKYSGCPAFRFDNINELL